MSNDSNPPIYTDEELWYPSELFLYFKVDGGVEEAKELLRNTLGASRFTVVSVTSSISVEGIGGKFAELEGLFPTLLTPVPYTDEVHLSDNEYSESEQLGLTNAELLFLVDPATNYQFSLVVEFARALAERTNVVLLDTHLDDVIVYTNLDLEGPRLEPSRIPAKPAEFNAKSQPIKFYGPTIEDIESLDALKEFDPNTDFKLHKFPEL